jgi:mRNA interferase RelE/StbE
VAEYRVVFARSARRELENLDEPLRSRIFRHIERLGRVPRPPDCRKLVGAESLWRIRVGSYRVVYALDDSRRVVDVAAVRHRRDAYR